MSGKPGSAGSPIALSQPTQDGVFVLTMQNGENRFSPATVSAFHDALTTVEAYQGQKALVITGCGKFFSNGLDLRHVAKLRSAERIAEYLDLAHTLLRRVLLFPAPVVAAVNGHAFAGGAMLALACNWRIMREDRGFLCLNEVHIGLPFTRGMAALIRSTAGERNLRDVAFCGKRIDANEAWRRGIVDQKVPADQVLPSAISIATKLAKEIRHPNTMGEIKAGMLEDAAACLAAKVEPSAVQALSRL